MPTASHLKPAIEALLLMNHKPISLAKMRELIDDAIEMDEYKNALAEMIESYKSDDHGIELVEIGGGVQFRTKVEQRDLIRQMFQIQPVRMSQAMLEVLSIVAFNQPATREKVEDIRGVECGHHLRNLMEKKMVRMVGRSEAPGKPMLYGTTKEFLELFGLPSLKDLPSLREIEEMLPKNEVGNPEDEEARVAKELESIVENAEEIDYSDIELEEAEFEKEEQEQKLAKEALEKAEQEAALQAAEDAEMAAVEAQTAEVANEESEASVDSAGEQDLEDQEIQLNADQDSESVEGPEAALELIDNASGNESQSVVEEDSLEEELTIEADEFRETSTVDPDRLEAILADSEELNETTVERTEGENHSEEENQKEPDSDRSETLHGSDTSNEEARSPENQSDEVAGAISFGRVSALQDEEWELDEVPSQYQQDDRDESESEPESEDEIESDSNPEDSI